MSAAELVMHVGAPKCGSSALQTALTMTPDFASQDGTAFRYVAGVPMLKHVFTAYGSDVRLIGKKSPYGYASWPNVSPKVSEKSLARTLSRVRKSAKRNGVTPIVSSEGWISRHAFFRELLAEWGNPPVDVVAFLRPPVEWANAAYWQWGVWHAPTMDAWLRYSQLPYSFGEDLEAWSQIPGVRLRVGRSRPDVIQRFRNMYDVALPKVEARNSSSPPSLIGVLTRNRDLRLSGHTSSIEFVFQRWCPPVPGRKLWIIRARHVHALRETTTRNLEALRRCLSEGDFEDLMQDPRWLQEKPYHATINAGESPIDDLAEYPRLYDALRQGGEAASQAAGGRIGTVPPCPDPEASLEAWDAVLVDLLKRLVAADTVVREHAGKGRFMIRAAAKLRDKTQL